VVAAVSPQCPQDQQRLPALALALLTLALVIASLAMMGYQLALPEDARFDFLLRNTLGVARRAKLLGYIAASVLVVPVGFGFLWLFLRRRAELLACRVATLLGPLVVAAALPSLFIGRLARQYPLGYLAWLLLVTLLFRALVTRSVECLTELLDARLPRAAAPWWQRLRMPAWGYLGLVCLAATGYTAYTGYYTILNHHRIQTMAFDLGIYDNLMFNALHGRPFHSPVLFGPGSKSYIAGHAEYAMVLFVPLYALKPGPEMLLVLQSALLGFAAVPLYLFAARFLSKPQAAVLAIAYLLYAPLHGPNFYDFHWLPLAIFFHFWLYWAIAARKDWLAVVTILVLFAIREDIPVGLACLGAFLFLTGARQRLGLALAISSVAWFGINKFVIMPRAGTWWFENIYKDLFADGKSSYGSVIQTMVTNPSYTAGTVLHMEKLEYALHMLVPLALLPVRRGVFLLLLFPAAMFTILTTGYSPTISIAFQYTTHAIPYLFLAAVLGLWLMKSEPRGDARTVAAVAAVLLATLSHSKAYGAILQQERFTGGFSSIQFDWTPAMQKRYAELRSVTSLIPTSASVAATEFMVPHVSTRKEAYVTRQDFGEVDYIFVSTLELHGAARNLVSQRVKQTPYGLLKNAGEFYLLKRDHYSPETQSALRRLGLQDALKVSPPVTAPPPPPQP
jgi:uncharacterized membrane protein